MSIRILIFVIPGLIGLVTFVFPVNLQEISTFPFADQRILLGIPNFTDVFTSIPFFVMGILGLKAVNSFRKFYSADWERTPYIVFFSSVICVSFGSTYFHLLPSKATQFWDRLPMAVAFVSLFTVIIVEFVSFRVGKLLFPPLLIVGFVGVLRWHLTGDLRLYSLIQFYPLVVIALVLLVYKSRYSCEKYWWGVLSLYFVAKIAELLDGQIYLSTGFISGHSLKHILVAAAIGWLVAMLKNRKLESAEML